MRFRFSLKSLLWAPLLVAAFFLGRHSEALEFKARQWWDYKRICWGAAPQPGQAVVAWPPGSLTFNLPCPVSVPSAQAGVEQISVSRPSNRQITISPRAEGRFRLNWVSSDGAKAGQILGEVADGELMNYELRTPVGMGGNAPRVELAQNSLGEDR